METKDKYMTLLKMGEAALVMRPETNKKQLTEAMKRAWNDFADEEPTSTEDILMRLEFHLDDVLGHGDEEYAYAGDE